MSDGSCDRMRTALIGLGKQATENYLPGLIDSQLAQLVAVCDVDVKNIEGFMKKLSVRGYTDFRSLLNTEQLDFVIVAAPHDVHAEIVEYAARKGVHILKEKPFARSLEEGNRLLEQIESYGIHLVTTLQRRYNPIYTTFFNLVDQIGNIKFIEGKYTLCFEKPSEGWRGDKARAGGGCLIDMGYHVLDMIIWYFGLPDAVIAEFQNNVDAPEETAVVTFKYHNGTFGSVLISRNCPPKTEFIKAYGNYGCVEVERGRIRRLKKNGEIAESLIREKAWAIATTKQIDSFCRILMGKTENTGSPAYHLQHLRFIEACYLSQSRAAYVNPKEL